MHGGNRRWVPLPIGVKILCALYLHYKVEFTFKKIKGLNWGQQLSYPNWSMLLHVNRLHGSVAWKPKNAPTETRRQT